MSRFLGYKDVRLSAIVKHGQWRALLREPRITTLAESIKSEGQIQAPVIEKSSMRIVSGADRVAAHDFLGAEWIEVRMWQGTEAEMLAIRRAENFHRRAFSPVERAEMLADVRAEVKRAELAPEVQNHSASPRPAHRPKSPKNAAIERQAAERGVTRQAQKKQITKAEAAEPAPAAAAVDPWLVMPPRAQLLQKHLRVLADKLSAALGYITSELLDGAGVLPGTVDAAVPAELRRIIQRAAKEVRDKTPERACPYCKLLPDRIPNCPACHGDGYIVAHQLRDIPKELLREGAEAGVFVGHKFVLLTDYGKKRTA